MINTIERLLCQKLELNAGKFKKNELGEYTASKDKFSLRKYVGAFWTGLEVLYKEKEYLELDVTCDGNEATPSDKDSFILEVKVAAAKVNAFRKAVDNSAVNGTFYDRLKEGCRTRIESTDDPVYSALTIEIKPGEETQVAELVCSILTYKTKSSQHPGQQKNKLKKTEKAIEKLKKKSGISSED